LETENVSVSHALMKASTPLSLTFRRTSEFIKSVSLSGVEDYINGIPIDNRTTLTPAVTLY